MDVTLVLGQYGHLELTEGCLVSLRRVDSVEWPVVVVDDGSDAECRERMGAWEFSGVRVEYQEHRGVSAAWNRGARAAGTGVLVFLNNDVVSLGPWVERLVAPLREARVSIAGARLRREGSLPADLLEALPTRMFLEGWCFAVRADDFERLGGFDQAMRLYWSDTDFQLRLWMSRGSGLERFGACPAGLRLKHLGHRTAHDRRMVADRRGQWVADRDVFLRKWREGLSTGGQAASGTRRGNLKYETRNPKQIPSTNFESAANGRE